MRNPSSKVWVALTDPDQLREWAPFGADRSLGTVGAVTLTTVGTPTPIWSETRMTRGDAPRSLESNWGDQQMPWKLEPTGSGTRLAPWHAIKRDFVSMGAAGWHICLDVSTTWWVAIRSGG